MKRLWKLIDSSITNRLIFYFTMVAIVPLVVLQIITIYINNNAARTIVLNSVEQEVNSTLSNVEKLFDRTTSLCGRIQDNAAFQRRMRTVYSDIGERFSDELEGQAELLTILGESSDIYGIYLLGRNGFCCKSATAAFRSSSYTSAEWFSGTMDNGETWYGLHNRSYVVETANEGFISYSMPFVNRANGYMNGIIMADISTQALSSAFLNMNDNGSFLMLLGENNEDIYHSQSELATTKLLEQVYAHDFGDSKNGEINVISLRDALIMYSRSAATGWVLVGVVPTSYISNLFSASTVITLVMAIAVLVVVTLIAVGVAKRFTQPIIDLSEAMQAVEEGDLSVTLGESGTDEFSGLTRSFNHMVRRIDTLLQSTYAQQRSMRKAEFRALQAQINPHFLYNSLDSIVWLLRLKQNDTAIDLLQNLTILFRISLNSGREMLKVSQEVQHVRSYLVIESVRYSRKFEAHITECEALSDYITPKLILQPVVENSIYHAISKEKPFINIHISTEDAGDSIIFRVWDDGMGMTKETLHALQNAIDPSVDNADADRLLYAGKERLSKSSGYGLRNINERIKVLFGEAYGLTVNSNYGSGTECVIIIPKRTEDCVLSE